MNVKINFGSFMAARNYAKNILWLPVRAWRRQHERIFIESCCQPIVSPLSALSVHGCTSQSRHQHHHACLCSHHHMHTARSVLGHDVANAPCDVFYCRHNPAHLSTARHRARRCQPRMCWYPDARTQLHAG
jgi:hypothetical protein